MNIMKEKIEQAFNDIATINQANANSELIELTTETINMLSTGKLRVSEKKDNQWQTNQWVKKAILLSFKLLENKMITNGHNKYFDKIKLKFTDYTPNQFQEEQIRIVPNAIVRHGSFIGKNCVVMPSYINIGAFIDSGTMVDTWATIGSCAQIGKNVHISGGVGIGGVLEPLQANPTIIEDNCFIGARSEIVEGVIVEEGSVIAMGVYLSQTTKIYNRMTGEISYGRIPKGSVVVPGSIPSKCKTHNLNAAIIVKSVDQQTKNKTSINNILRDYE